MLKSLKNNWNSLVVFATFLVTTVSPFLIAPPYDLKHEGWFKYEIFLVALLTGLWLIPIRIWSRRAHLWHWWLAAVLVTALSVPTFLHYTSLLDRWTIVYFKENRLVIGEHKTVDADGYSQTLAKEGSPVDDFLLLQKYDGDASKVWQNSEIESRERAIVAWYIGALLLLASAPITVAQALYCASSKIKINTRRSG